MTKNPFAHGQLYVGLSRARCFDGVKIFSTSMKNGVGPVVYNKVNYDVFKLLNQVF